MCLTVNRDTTVMYADEDIVCYKLLNKFKSSSGQGYRYFSPYWGFMYLLGKNYVTTMKAHEYLRDGQLFVEQGFHSFFRKEDALDSFERVVGDNFGRNLALVRCVIPAGSEYYVGTWNVKRKLYDNYVSNSLRIEGDV